MNKLTKVPTVIPVIEVVDTRGDVKWVSIGSL